jgi:hypothetical protein
MPLDYESRKDRAARRGRVDWLTVIDWLLVVIFGGAMLLLLIALGFS